MLFATALELLRWMKEVFVVLIAWLSLLFRF
jgi:hypothetical protein